ncbi:MAG TPA: aminotransferase class I/II-fold pyridoxal phosphate-dependent enzyme [Dongiaceae bacterium]|nr:aminotransferase class I/II-fold pyridoxal phosphate-dependent enzyme [Dongiaceae bacterium]
MVLKSARRGSVDPFIVMEVLREANRRSAAGESILHLEVGQPSTPAPLAVRKAAQRALENDLIGYTDALGLPALRTAIARHYRDFYGVNVPVDRIVVTTGSSAGFLLAFLACFDPGDRVALASPGYPCYRNILQVLDIEPVLLPMTAATKFQPTAAILEQADLTDIAGLIIASPSNPVGALIAADEQRRLTNLCRQRGWRLIADEIYHGITYEHPAATMAAFNDDAIIVNSFSKYFSMTGWRLGWLILPPALLQQVERLQQNLFISPPSLSQHAAIAAFEAHEELQRNLQRYAANRSILLNELPQAGFDKLVATDGAFYVYADVGEMTDDSVAFARRILTEIGVAVTPGVDFDPARGQHFLRFSFAGSTEDMVEAMRRLRDWRR